MEVFLFKLKKIVALVSLILCIFHIYTSVSFLMNHKLANKSLPLEGSLDSQLAFIHLVLMVFLLIYMASMIFESLAGKTISLVSSILIVLVYLGWYYEKFAYLEPEGTPEYQQQINEIGFFQGATNLDYVALGITLLLVVYSVLRFLDGIYVKRKN